MIDDWVTDGTLRFLDRQEVVIISKDGRAIKAYMRAD